jgi:hypothetical protein
MAEFCRKMSPAGSQRREDGAVVRYYRSLLPLIEQQFAACPNPAHRLEPAMPAPSRVGFVEEDGGWRLDLFDLYMPPGKEERGERLEAGEERRPILAIER